MRAIRLLIAASLLLLGIMPISAAPSAPWQEKVDPAVLAAAQSGASDFLVILRGHADLEDAAALGGKRERGTYVYETLSTLAEATQKPLRATLDKLGAAYQPFWVVNALWVRGDLDLIQQIAQRTDVAQIVANPRLQMALPTPEAGVQSIRPNALQWNIAQIGAAAP